MVNENTTDSLWESTEAIHGPLYESPEAAATEARTQALEGEGLTRSDAQGVVMAEAMRRETGWKRFSVDELLELKSSNKEKEYPFTIDQVDAIAVLYGRNPDGSATLSEFAERFSHQIGDYVGADWCSMHIGIEACGHTHS